MQKTQYTTRISFTVPAANIDAANEFMAWCLYGIGDRNTFRVDTENPSDACVASGAFKPEVMARLNTPVTEDTRPEWGEDLDLTLAQQGQALMEMVIDETSPQRDMLKAKEKVGALVVSMKGVAKRNTKADWKNNQDVKIGDVRTRDGIDYVCVRPHTTSNGKLPPQATLNPSLWAMLDPLA